MKAETGAGERARVEHGVHVPAGAVMLEGELWVPAAPDGVVLFAHGSGSSRKSPRNRFVAGSLERAGFATLLFDLLTEEEEQEDRFSGRFRFDIERLALRLADASDWIHEHPSVRGVRQGFFGASTGAAAALIAAAERPRNVGAVVSRGGRPDLAGDALERVRAPTLLIVGGDDAEVLALNRGALARLRAPRKLEVVPGATHLFEEPGALDRVAHLATEWFDRHLPHPDRPRPPAW